MSHLPFSMAMRVLLLTWFALFCSRIDAQEQTIENPLQGLRPRVEEDLSTPADTKKTTDSEESNEGEAKKKVLNEFFTEMEALVAGTDKLSLVVKELKEQLKHEYQSNEHALQRGRDEDGGSEPSRAKQIEQRQKVIAQYVIELSNRDQSRDPRQRFDVQRKVIKGFREFEKKHPELAKGPEFTRKQRDLTNLAMRGNFVPGRDQPPSLAETMRGLSSTGALPRPIQGLSSAHPGEQEGAIQGFRVEMQSLFKLIWDRERLTLDRGHWDDAFAGRTADDIRADIDDVLKQNGIAPQDDDGRRARFGIGPLGSSNLERLFSQFRGNGGGFSRSGSGDEFRATFRNADTTFSIAKSPNKLVIQIEETGHPERILRIRQSTNDGLRITLVGDLIHRFHQSGTGDVSIVEVLGDDIKSLHASSFARLYRQQPRYIEERFFPLLDHLGIIPPLSRFDHRVVKRVIERLAVNESGVREHVDRLVKQMDSDKFTQREASYQELKDGLDTFYESLQEKRDTEDLSTEVLARIRRLLNTSAKKEVFHFDATISALELTSDLAYLSEVREIVDEPERQSIDRRLAQLSLDQ